MKDLSPDDRPREKLLRHGAAALGDNELVALVLGSGRAHAGALDVANDLLRARGGLHGLARCVVRRSGAGRRHRRWPRRPSSSRRWSSDGGRSRSRRAARVQLAHAARRGGVPAAGVRVARRSSSSASVLLDTKHRVLRTTVVAIGTLNSTVVEPRDVFREAMLGAAAAVVVFHNHPSGDPSPSPDDVELTRRLAAVGELMGIPVVDHIVLGDARYCSLKEMGEL